MATVLDVPAADLCGAVNARVVVLNTCYLGVHVGPVSHQRRTR
ncbi:MAG: hypothetical protein ACRDTB_05560 [Actinophytocola sp.]